MIKIDKKEITDEQVFELATEAGADECKSNNEYHEIQCEVNEIYNVKKELEKKYLILFQQKLNGFHLTELKLKVKKMKM